jgi:cytosine/adenosine deaminase-related metal-dependent hydrolase
LWFVIRMATLFRDALLVQLYPPSVAAGDLRVANEQIVAIDDHIQIEPGDEIVECGGAVLMPGLVNGHTHLYSTLAIGMPAPPRPPRNFHEILQFIWWRLDRAHTLESIEFSGQVGALAALRCGTTTLVDHHASPGAIEDSLSALEKGVADVGCRGVFCYEVTDRNRSDEARQGLAENERYLAECARRADGRFAGMVGAHASFTLEEDSLVACVDLAKRKNAGVHIHAAEDPVDERITRERFGCGLIERFERVGLLEVTATILAHGTHFSDRDFTAIIERRDTLSLAHNPSSNMNNGVGYTPVAKLVKPPLLGTDGIGADMWREARVAEFKSHDAVVVRGSPDPAQGSDRRSPHAPPTETYGLTTGEVGRPAPNLGLPFGKSLEMLAASARAASNCLGVKLGVLEPGAAADLVLTDYRPAAPLTADTLAGHFLFAMGPEFVRSVMIAGRWCLKNRVAVACDEASIRANAAGTARALHERMAAM